MSKTTKIILTVLGLLILGLSGLILLGMHSMEIDDKYGDNQDIFYNSNQGNIVINHQTKELGQISKTWTNFYIIYHKDTLDIYEWWDDKNIEIFRLVDKNLSVDNLNYEDIDGLKNENKIELLKRLR